MAKLIPLLFDPLFSTISGGFIPVPFLRALSYHESSLNPNLVTKSSNATGLFQVVPTVLKDYNLQHGTKYTLDDTKDPILNSKIGIGLITRIVKSYQKNHPNTLAVNWNDPRFVELVVQGFNAGYSESGGVGFVVGKMEKIGVPPEKITVDTVAEAAKQLKASKYLSLSDRVAYAKAVARTAASEMNRFSARKMSMNDHRASDVSEASSDSLPRVEKVSDVLARNDVAMNGNKDTNVTLKSQSPLPKLSDMVTSPSENHVTSTVTLGNTLLLMSFPFVQIIGVGLASLLRKRRTLKAWV